MERLGGWGDVPHSRAMLATPGVQATPAVLATPAVRGAQP